MSIVAPQKHIVYQIAFPHDYNTTRSENSVLLPNNPASSSQYRLAPSRSPSNKPVPVVPTNWRLQYCTILTVCMHTIVCRPTYNTILYHAPATLMHANHRNHVVLPTRNLAG